jgi:acyl-CoA thioester hydrolase
MDAGGHVHHSVALCYFEEAREAYWRSVVGDTKYVLAELEIKYHQRILYPMMIEVGARIAEIGRKHLIMEYEGSSEGGDLLISGNTLLAMFDYRKGVSVRVPATVNSAIQ